MAAVDPGLLVGLGMAAAACVGGGWWCLRRLGQARLLEDMPTSKVRSAAQGYVELYGVLQPGPGESLNAPLTGKPCLWWRYRIEEYHESGKSKSWRTLESACSEGWLGFADGSGQCLINPLGAEVRPLHRQVWYGDQRHPRGTEDKGLFFTLLGAVLDSGKRYRYIEERLHVGEPLYALGEFRTSGGGRQGLDLAAAQGAVVREWKQDFQGLLARFDRARAARTRAPRPRTPPSRASSRAWGPGPTRSAPRRAAGRRRRRPAPSRGRPASRPRTPRTGSESSTAAGRSRGPGAGGTGCRSAEA